MTNPNALPSADKALNTDAYFRLYQGALKIKNPRARLAACYIILLAGRLGFRLQEIQHLREEWIDWRRGEIKIPSYDPCGCKQCWITARDIWGRRGLSELQEKGEWADDVKWRDLNADARDTVVEKASYCRPETLEDILYSERWEPKYDRSARTVPFGWSERITACLMTFFDHNDCLQHQRFPVSRLIKKAAENANGLEPDELSPHPLRATGLTFLADISVDPKMLCDLAGWQDIQTATRYLRQSGRITSHKVYSLLGKENEAPPVVPAEPEYQFPVVMNPIPFDGEPFSPITPDGIRFDRDVRLTRHHEQRNTPILLVHPREASLPFNYAGFPDADELSYDPRKHDLPGKIKRDSDRVQFEDGQPVTTATTIADTEDPHRVDPSEHAPPEEYRAETVDTRLSDYHDDDHDSNRMAAATITGAAAFSVGAVWSRLGQEWAEYWTADEGAVPSAERLAKGMAAYLVLVVGPLAVDLSLLFQ